MSGTVASSGHMPVTIPVNILGDGLTGKVDGLAGATGLLLRALQDSSGADVTRGTPTSGSPTTFDEIGQFTYTVPATGLYDIEAIGASGSIGLLIRNNSGLGADVSGDFQLTAGEVLRILVGGSTLPPLFPGSGGGSSSVDLDPEPRSNAGPPVSSGGGGTSGPAGRGGNN
jgi:hypothetical protein